MSRALSALARLARAEAETVQRELALLDARDAELARRIAELPQRLAREGALAHDALSHGQFAAYAELERKRARLDAEERARIAAAAAGLRERLAEAFREAKKLETLLEAQALEARRESARREQAAADDRAVMRR